MGLWANELMSRKDVVSKAHDPRNFTNLLFILFVSFLVWFLSLITSIFSLIFTLQWLLLEVKVYFGICENNLDIPQRRRGAEENGWIIKLL